jgi:hypothetical protein
MACNVVHFAANRLKNPPGCGMMEIKLKPSFSHCVETVAKREYERVLSLLLGGKQEDRLLDELELLRLFLESADLRKLRSRCEESLLAGKQIEFILRSSDGVSAYETEIREESGEDPGKT